jgi:hypothetical protein
MSEIFEPSLLDLGPQVAIVDDVIEEAGPIADALTAMNIGNQFIYVDLANPVYPEKPLHNVELVFLDLHYGEGLGLPFEPYICCEILQRIVPPGQKYVLVIWSKDVHKSEEVLALMKEVGITPPVFLDISRKDKYQIEGGYDIGRLLQDLRGKLKNFQVTTLDYTGQIIEIREKEVIINCLIRKDPPAFEIRTFERSLFEDLSLLKEHGFLHIRIVSRPGERSITFVPEENDLSEKFKKPESEPEDLSWLNDSEK